MLVFIGMIPMAITCDDLHRFVYKGLGSFWTSFFGGQGIIAELSIIRIAIQNTHLVQYHGLVDIEPATSVQAVIKRLNRTRLNGVFVEVRKFIDRSPLRDRRKSQSGIETSYFKDLRKGDRRRCQLAVEEVPVSGFSNPVIY